WGKIRFSNGGDTIWAAEIVKQSERNMTRDATYLKYSHDVDKNRNFKNRPIVLERKAAYGQLLRIIEFSADFPDSNSETQPRGLLLAVIRPVKLLGKNANTPYYQDGKFAPIEVVDVDEISCLVARIPDHEPGPRRWALCERQDAMDVAEDEDD
ncbi:hypothetical protein DFH08DRAFT_710062, partial [Mycena albidolilacea]